MPRDNRCMYMTHFVFKSVVVTVGMYCEAWICRCSCMGSVSVSSCRCMFVSCVHSVAVLNAAFVMTLLMLVEDARDKIHNTPTTLHHNTTNNTQT